MKLSEGDENKGHNSGNCREITYGALEIYQFVDINCWARMPAINQSDVGPSCPVAVGVMFPSSQYS